MAETTKPEKTWGFLELMGHTKLAGRLSEHNFGGTFVRVDVPETHGSPAFTKLFGPGAIFGITFTSEEVARLLAFKLAIKPVQPWELSLSPASARYYAIEEKGDGPENDPDFVF